MRKRVRAEGVYIHRGRMNVGVHLEVTAEGAIDLQRVQRLTANIDSGSPGKVLEHVAVHEFPDVGENDHLQESGSERLRAGQRGRTPIGSQLAFPADRLFSPGEEMQEKPKHVLARLVKNMPPVVIRRRPGEILQALDGTPVDRGKQLAVEGILAREMGEFMRQYGAQFLRCDQPAQRCGQENSTAVARPVEGGRGRLRDEELGSGTEYDPALRCPRLWPPGGRTPTRWAPAPP